MLKTSLALLLALILGAAPLPTNGKKGKKKAFVPDEACLECHDDIPDKTKQTFHHTRFEVNCQDCHGQGEAHIEEPETDNIVTPSGASGMATCLTCHERHIRPGIPSQNFHAQAEVFCSDCHLAHKFPEAPPEALLTRPAQSLCSDCHVERSLFEGRPFQHGQGHSELVCASCHNPHGEAGTYQLTSGPGGELVCLNCHSDKRGPFAFEHVNGIVGDCLTCHEQHGSSNPKQLTRVRVADLCLECHTTGTQLQTLGSQSPSFHDLRDPRYQNCTTCHTAIHGSHRSPRLLK